MLMTSSTASSRSEPIAIGMSQRRSVMSWKPALSRIPLVVSALAIENGPGPQVGSSYSSGLVTNRSVMVWARESQSFSTFARQTTMTSLPSGSRASRTLRRAATGLAKNIVPIRENASSKRSPKAAFSMSATSKRTLPMPACAASCFAVWMNRGAASTPRTSPVGPTRPAIRCVVSPKPQPMSSTRSPARGGTTRRASSPCAPSPVVMRWRNRTNASNSGPSQARIASSLAVAICSTRHILRVAVTPRPTARCSG